MKHTTITTPGVRVRLAAFEGTSAGFGVAGEWHAVFEVTDQRLAATEQYAVLEEAVRFLEREVLPEGAKAVFKRWFVSDAVGHGPRSEAGGAAVSIVGQPPLDYTKAALWCWWMGDARAVGGGSFEHGAYRHIFDTGLHSSDAGSTAIFRDYAARLAQKGLTLKDNAIRTWIYVQGVDTHYAEMVRARREFFAEQGLTPDTHFIASTGIEGRHTEPAALVHLDAYAVAGLKPEQITHFKAATHLNPTHEYGVTFERATAVDYGDRRHIFVSGTASIDNRGQIVAPGDVAAQTDRMLENIGALLAEGGADFGDVAQMIVYLRDPADRLTVAARLDGLLPDIPRVVVWAPVCRPGWLVEAECIAIVKTDNPDYPKL